MENRSRFWVSDNTRHYLFDPDGRQLGGPYRQVGELRDGTIEVSKDGQRMVIDLDGNIVGPVLRDPNVIETTDRWNLYHVDGMIDKPVRRHVQRWGYIDASGKVMIEARFDFAYAFEGDVARVRLDGDKVLINRAGESIGRADGCQDGLTKEMRGDRFVILGPDGMPINDETYQYVKLICGDPAVVMPDDDHMGLVRADGGLVGDRYFWRISPLHDGVAGVFIKSDRWGIIEATGEFILEPMEIAVVIGSTGLDRTSIHLPEGPVLLDRQVAERLAREPTPLLGRGDGPITCRDGITIGGEDGIVTYADVDGKPLIRGAFDYARCFGGGRAIVAMRDRQEWCEIDKRGNVLEGSCQCWQPIAIIEFDGSPREGSECYPHGLSVIGKHKRYMRDAWLSP